MMVRIFTKKELCPKPLITLNDKYFNQYVNAEYLDEQCRAWMLEIDDAAILDEKLLTMKTRFGVGSIRNLSTGTKTLINTYNLYRRQASGTIDVRETGENVIPHILKAVSGTDICLYTGSYNFVGLLDERHTFLLNNEYTISGTVNLSLKLEELKEGNLRHDK